MSRVATSIAWNDEEGLPTVVWDDDHGSMTIRQHRVQLSDVPIMYEAILSGIQTALEDLAGGVDLTIPFPSHKIADDTQNLTPEYNFVGTDNTKLQALQYRVLKSFSGPEWFVAKPGGGVEWKRARVATWMQRAEVLNQLFMVAIHIGGGQPARGTEILSVLVRNRQNAMRNLFALCGGMATVISYNKVGTECEERPSVD
jgi:bloom syndrome protein